MDGGNLDRIVQRLRDSGVTMLIGPKAWDSGQWMTNVIWKEVRDALKQRMPELKVYAWGYCYPSTAVADGARAAECVTYGQADGVVLDVEIEFENHPREAQLLCERFRSQCPDTDLLYSTFALPAYHSAFPYSTFQRYCNGLVPQLYFTYWIPPTGNMFQNVTAAAGAMCTQHGAIGIGSDSLIVTADLYDEGGHRAPTAAEMEEFARACKQLNCGGIAAWSYQHMSDALWSAFQRAEAIFASAAPSDPCAEVKAQLAAALRQVDAQSALLSHSVTQIAELTTERDNLRRQVETIAAQRDAYSAQAEKRLKRIRELELIIKGAGQLAKAVSDSLNGVKPYTD
jgi:hypothetical protein